MSEEVVVSIRGKRHQCLEPVQLVELLAFKPGNALLLAEAKSCIAFSRNASELRPPSSKSNNAAFTGEEERRERRPQAETGTE